MVIPIAKSYLDLVLAYIKSNHHIVRFHVGLEDPNDLINDLKQGLKKIK